MMPALILPFADTDPSFGGPAVFAGPRSAVLGRATIGAGGWFGETSVVRADGEVVRIGDGVHLGPRATVHIVHDVSPCIIGDNVTVGANSVVHACTVGNDCVIEHDVTILDDARIEAGVLIEPGSTVFPRKVLASGWVYAGSPAKPVRELGKGELAARAATIRARDAEGATPAGTEADPTALDAAPDHGFGGDVFVASTARCRGRVRFAPHSGLFFGCVADAGTGSIVIGENTNVQDNTLIRAGDGDTVIGRDVTIGHNVLMDAVRVGDRSLVGMGVHLVPGVWVQDDVLVAAGTTTEPGQILETGWLWGGRPARPLSRLDEARRTGMREVVEQYCGYMRTFGRLQRSRLRIG